MSHYHFSVSNFKEDPILTSTCSAIIHIYLRGAFLVVNLANLFIVDCDHTSVKIENWVKIMSDHFSCKCYSIYIELQ